MGFGDFMGEAFVDAFKQPSVYFQNKNVEKLARCLDDPMKSAEAVRYLLLLGDTTIETLDRYLNHEDMEMRLASAGTYAVLVRELAKNPSLQELVTNDAPWREGARKSVGPLAQALHDKSSKYREMAATSLGWTGVEQAIEPLIQALADGDMDIRNTVARALGTIGEVAVDPLITSLTHPEWIVRERAAWVLGEIGNTKAVEPLIQALRDEDNDVHLSAQGALQKMAEKSEAAENAYKDESLVRRCWYCDQHLADPRLALEKVLKRNNSSVTVRVQRCSQCEAQHRRGTKLSKFIGMVIVIACPGSCIITNEIYRSSTGVESWIPGVVVGVIVSALVVGVYFVWSIRSQGGVTKGSDALLRPFPKIQDMTQAGWKARAS